MSEATGSEPDLCTSGPNSGDYSTDGSSEPNTVFELDFDVSHADCCVELCGLPRIPCCPTAPTALFSVATAIVLARPALMHRQFRDAGTLVVVKRPRYSATSPKRLRAWMAPVPVCCDVLRCAPQRGRRQGPRWGKHLDSLCCIVLTRERRRYRFESQRSMRYSIRPVAIAPAHALVPHPWTSAVGCRLVLWVTQCVMWLVLYVAVLRCHIPNTRRRDCHDGMRGGHCERCARRWLLPIVP
jgi:hypothetical protein